MSGIYGDRVGEERILLVEDDARIGANLVRALEHTGYAVSWTQTGAEGIASAATTRPDLVLLDLGLPDMDGLDVCRAISHSNPDAVIIMLTARDEELDVVVGLDAGAVDYVTKPFKLAELLARVRAQLRRIPMSGESRSEGGLIVDPGARRASLNGTTLDLRNKEFDLLARLVVDIGRVVSRETLMADVWDEHWFGSTKTLDFHIAALRRKIDVDGAPSRITTLRSVGFRFEES
ncbi:MAG: two component transcriptional regulator, winged helix family [Ilumatobacteraceae bacterium]|nr:two component transcriptional regulator, winged helix family [Ilumatobacteraceae bacterium]